MSTWEIAGQPDGSALIVHDGVTIGRIAEDAGRRQEYPGGGLADGMVTRRREYTVRGRTVEVVEDGRENDPHAFGITVFYAGIGASMAETTKVTR